MRVLITRLSAFKKQFYDVVGVGMLRFLTKYAGATGVSSVVQQGCEDVQLGIEPLRISDVEEAVVLFRAIQAFNSNYIRKAIYGGLPFILRVACAISALAPDYNQRFSRNVTLYEHRLLRRLCTAVGLGPDSILLHNVKCYHEELLAWALLHDQPNNRLLVIIQGISQLHNASLLLCTNPTKLPSGSTVHTGVYRAACPLYEILSPYIHMNFEHSFLRDYSVVLCGHGFGGSVAALVGAMLLRHPTGTFTPSNTKVVTFGPFPFAGPDFVYKEHIHIMSFIYRFDAIARLSLHAAEVLKTRKVAREEQSTSALSQKVLLNSLSKDCAYFIPGTIYLLHPGMRPVNHTPETSDASIDILINEEELEACTCYRAIDSHDLAELVLSEQAVDDHFMYEDALKSLCVD
ncbi:Hypothetical protein GLP15_2505 [Giardia lamblia P15]|uniref:sn-1-specific diacylglycerol lipase n=1 Tax=Giardia intestinalis (strain P15) TaxID=658858 RepID=E1EXA1_GIAIA|nr:Hypothetical protein GLP15_2505 [Giardia lamblia P15]